MFTVTQIIPLLGFNLSNELVRIIGVSEIVLFEKRIVLMTEQWSLVFYRKGVQSSDLTQCRNFMSDKWFQGNDVGTQYRSGLYYTREDQKPLLEKSKEVYQNLLSKPITTEILPAGPFYYAEDYHQQYLHKNPGGYCSMRGTGVACPKVEL